MLALPYNGSNTQTVSYLADDLMLATGRLATRIESGLKAAAGACSISRCAKTCWPSGSLASICWRRPVTVRAVAWSISTRHAREFATTMRELNDAHENTPASREALNLANAMDVLRPRDQRNEERQRGDSRPQHVATASERITEVLDAVGQQYALDAGNLRFAAATTSMRRN